MPPLLASLVPLPRLESVARLVLWEVAIKTLMGALVDAAGIAVGMPDAKSNQGPSQAAIWPLTQSKDKAERRGRRPGGAERHIELATAGEPDSTRAFCFTGAPRQPSPASFNFSPGAFRLDTSWRASIEALNLLLPHGRSELDRSPRGSAPGFSATAIPRRQGGSRLP